MVEGSKVILCYMVTGKYISVIAKVYIRNLREIPKLFKSMGFFYNVDIDKVLLIK